MIPTKEQLDKCQADHRDEGIVGTLLIRKISTHITKYVVQTTLTPNQITFISLLIGVIGAVFVSFGIWKYMIIGGILILFSYVVDNVDGEVARIKKMCSSKGAFIDATFDRIKEGVIFIAIANALCIQTGMLYPWIWGMIAMFSVFMSNLVIQDVGKMDKTVLKSMHSSLPIVGQLRKYGVKQSFLTSGIDVQLFIVFVGAITNQLYYTLLYFMIIQNLYWIGIFTLTCRSKK